MQRTLLKFLQWISVEKLLALFFFLSLPMLFAPYITDDYFHLLMLSDSPPIPKSNDGSLWGLFSFIDNTAESRAYLMQQGVLPWWTAEGFYFKFWRPLAEITHCMDYILANKKPFFAHLHNTVWFFLTVIIYGKIYKKLTVNKTLAMLALSLFVLNGHHVPTIEWIANRNALMAAFFTALCLYWHITFRESNKNRYMLFALISLVLGLFSGESSIAFMGFMFAYAWCLDSKGKVGGCVYLIPYAIVVILWYWQYKTFGYGANGSAIHYVDPAAMPKEFFFALLERVPVYVFSFVSVIPAEIYPALQLFLSEKTVSVVLLAIVIFLALLTLLWLPVLRKNTLLHFALVGAVFSTIPFCSVINQDRLTLIPSFGFDLALAIIIYAVVVDSVRIWSGKFANKLAISTVYVLCVLHFIISPLYLLGASFYIQTSSKHQEQRVLNVDDALVDKKKVVIFKGSMTTSALLKPVRLLNEKSVPDNVWLLSNNKGQLSIKRINENRLLIKRDIGFVEGFEESFRDLDRMPFHVSDVINSADLTIVIKEVTVHGQPVLIECQFEKGLNSGEYRFLSEEKGGELKEIALPGIGETLVI